MQCVRVRACVYIYIWTPVPIFHGTTALCFVWVSVCRRNSIQRWVRLAGRMTVLSPTRQYLLFGFVAKFATSPALTSIIPPGLAGIYFIHPWSWGSVERLYPRRDFLTFSLTRESLDDTLPLYLLALVLPLTQQHHPLSEHTQGTYPGVLWLQTTKSRLLSGGLSEQRSGLFGYLSSCLRVWSQCSCQTLPPNTFCPYKEVSCFLPLPWAQNTCSSFGMIRVVIWTVFLSSSGCHVLLVGLTDCVSSREICCSNKFSLCSLFSADCFCRLLSITTPAATPF